MESVWYRPKKSSWGCQLPSTHLQQRTACWMLETLAVTLTMIAKNGAEWTDSASWHTMCTAIISEFHVNIYWPAVTLVCHLSKPVRPSLSDHLHLVVSTSAKLWGHKHPHVIDRELLMGRCTFRIILMTLQLFALILDGEGFCYMYITHFCRLCYRIQYFFLLTVVALVMVELDRCVLPVEEHFDYQEVW